MRSSRVRTGALDPRPERDLVISPGGWLVAGLCVVWLALQMPFWRLPPHGDTLGHMFPQAWALFQQPWNLGAIARSQAAEHPPFITWMIMAGWKLFGITLVWPHILSSALGVLAIVGTYRLGLDILDRPRALAAATCLAANSLFFAQAINLYLATPVTAGLTWATHSLIRGNCVALSFWVAFMTLSKETSLPLLVPMVLFALWRYTRVESERSGRWGPVVAIVLGSVPVLAWIGFARLESGAWLATSMAAASTNGSIPSSTDQLVRKLAFGPLLLLLQGLWIPLVAIFCLAVRPGLTQYRNRIRALPTLQAITLLLVGIASAAFLTHAVISIQLNRYYLPILALLWVVAWWFLPFSSGLARRTVIATSILWSLFSYTHGTRYAGSQDFFAAVPYVSAHRQIGQTLDRIDPSGAILTGYPSTVELTLPCAGYVMRPHDALDVTSTTDKDITDVDWALVGIASPFYDQVLQRLSGRHLSLVDRRGHGDAEILLYRVSRPSHPLAGSGSQPPIL